MGYRLTISLLVTFYLQSLVAVAANVEKYLPKMQQYKQEITKPEAMLGFGLGERHIRHDQLVHYLEQLAKESKRIKLTNIGYTKEMRKQLLLTVSTPENLAQLPHLLQQAEQQSAEAPLVIWLGYSVHGDEISGSNAALAVAYYLAASNDESVQQILKDTIIVIEPSINPDGMDRFVNWVNTHRGSTENADPNHIEHHQGWRTGRTNHFGFDLNRDWLLLTQQETQNRMRYYHQYQPHVLGDYHEMGANGSYFFQPGILSRTHPLTPKTNTELTQLLATFHAKALDRDNRLYYSQEKFDDFYYGKGSTYPDINGGVGILFEQASSRGVQQDTVNGLLTFEYGIQNHVYTSLSTINGAWQNRTQFKQYRKKFYQEALKLADDEKFTGYLLTEKQDKYRLNTFLTKLKQHQINVYPLTEDFRLDGKLYQKESSYYLPLAQKQYRVIQALFNQQQEFQDNTFYDVSGWTLPLAMDIDFQTVKRTWGLDIAKTPWQLSADKTISIDRQAYAYAFEWHDFLAPKLLNQLLAHGVQAKVANRIFSAQTQSGNKSFAAGAIIIPAAIQQQPQWRELVAQYAQENQIQVFSLTTGLTPQGIDLGSGSMRKIDPVKVLLVGGKGSSQYEAAEVLYYLDEMLSIPVTVVEQSRLSTIDLAQYSHLLMVDGSYKNLSKVTVENIKLWLESGGVLFGQKRAASWLAEKEIVKAKFVSKEHIDELFDTDGLNYQDKERLAARKRIAGAIFESQLDLSHPLAYGYTDQQLPLFRNSTLIIDSYAQPFMTVANYSAKPLMSGYTDRTLVNRIANNPAIIAHDYGKGRVIVSVDNLAFRGYWLGSAKILANSLFFAKAFSASAL
ncbi:peptidase M14 [Thalassotalea insulae]|uniref:Peptidase M14 n=1 Tax=Thalassotalea insulae TaxID=2056778 RepID=A0ABQ6GS03_9GAMM|nr:M14 family zinc carboxypeptidase [Thalassotalea insulae]GLX78716.1 peptidase M14 [Thalassotalea insulae]